MSKKSTIGILGFGTVGKSLSEVYSESFYEKPLIKDLDRNEFGDKLEVLNICIPWSENFVDIVVKEIRETKPDLTVIHSTVMPTTTRQVRKIVRRAVVHSPIRGIHPNLTASIKTHFIKYIGAENAEDGKLAKEHFKFVGIKRTEVLVPAVITELNKILSTTYYGHCISFTDYVDKICQKYNVSFKTFEKFNQSYNRGYRRLGMREQTNRPTLYPPKKKIGGTCVRENCEILKQCLNHELIDSILNIK